MSSFQFWKSWHKTDQIIFLVCCICIVPAIIFFWQGWLVSPAPVITFEHFQQVQQVEATSHTFKVGLINLAVPADSYVILENIFGSRLQPNVLASYIFLVGLSVSFLFLVTIISSLTRFWFLIGMGLVILFLSSLQLEALEVFGLKNKTIAITLVLLFGGLAYYFHFIKKEATFAQRLVSFLVLIVAVGLLLNFFSKAAVPFLHLSVNGLITGIILSVIFIMIVAHEIIAAFVTITTQSVKSSKSLGHFLVLTVAYLINLFLMFASKMGFIDWDFFTINSFFVLTVSAFLGVWGFRQRSPVYENILSTESLGMFFYCSMMLAAFSTLGYFASTASDRMMDAMDDLILAAHLGGGLIFALYIIANFAPMLVKNLPVHKVLYKPETMPYFTFRLMSVIATFAVLSLSASWKTYINQATASYYLAYGDLYLSQGDDATAETFYLKSVQFRNQNLHAHYALASIYSGRNDSFKEKKEFEKAEDRTPSVPVYLNLSRAYANHGDVLESALTIDEGKKVFPKSGELQNAAGLSFLKLKSIDSALYFFQRTKKSSGTKQVGETNYLAASALFKINNPLDTLISFEGAKKNGVNVNRLALANTQHRAIAFENKFIPDSVLSVYQALLLCNYFVNQKEKADTSLINQALRLERKPVNDDFKEQLLIASAHALYDQGQVKRALEIIRGVAFTAANGKTFSLMGLWLLEQKNPLVASAYFKMAAEKQQPMALYHQAIAETEADNLNQAYVSWDSLSRSKNPNVAAFAVMIKKVLLSKSSQTNTLTEEEKYYFCRYKIALTDSSLFEKTVNEIVDEKLKDRAMVDRSQKWFALDEIERSSKQLRQVSGNVDKILRAEMDQLGLILAAEKGDWNFVGKKLNSGVEVPFNQRIYLEALLAEQNGNAKAAAVRYHYLVNANNQFEEGIVAASRFFANDTTDRLKNFSLLVDGLLAKPNSVKILKQHVLQCIGLGLQQEAQDSLDKLRLLMLPSSFKKFIAAHPDYFGVEKNN